MRQLNNLTDRIRKLPLDKRGFPIPKFVQWIDGEPDFRVINPDHYAACIRHKKCWICGEQLGKYSTFVIGPMCVVNRVSSEPPMHLDCALFSVTNCPFLTQPMAKRNNKGLEDGYAPGIMIERNPGVTCVWVTTAWSLFRDGNGGFLIDVGEPYKMEFYSRGRLATRDEVMVSVNTGLPHLQKHVHTLDDERAFGEQMGRFISLMDGFNWERESEVR